MIALAANEARSNLNRIIDESAAFHEPLLIIGKRNNAVLVSESDWTAIQETLHSLSVPGIRESIVEGMKTPVSELFDTLEW